MEESKYNKLFAALAKAQGEIECAARTNVNTYYKSKYADMAELVKCSRPQLSANGLCVTQRIMMNGTMARPMLSTILGHSSGQSIESVMEIAPQKSDIHSFGSYMTYLKRYSYAAIVGIATEDDDGNSSMQPKYSSAQAPTLTDYKITESQLEQLEEEFKGHDGLKISVLEKLKITTLAEMPKRIFLNSLKRVQLLKRRLESVETPA